MPKNHNHKCTKCGRVKPIVFTQIINIAEKSVLVEPSEQWQVKFCVDCCVKLLTVTFGEIQLYTLNGIFKRYGKNITVRSERADHNNPAACLKKVYCKPS